ncbi:adenosylcobinamide-GDP ribazoletransferase [uncultured Sulfitobacter sp.]|uniref:adenosylcobinamide-GDP ribazoletransferase n=1 Tax=uncultured Sulfitobacter sp. TaxID=191468 RepID=UPI002628DE5E|nr:adenosylcobinamide-GDP ribazoletransferase [uncultured Sulfitobacter sp.]
MDKNDWVTQLWVAATLLTRLPLPHLPSEAFADGARAVWAYPLIGILVGGSGAAIGQTALFLGIPAYGAATLALGMMMLITGAMHEDGLADVFDGFWGGFASERRLEIMRDSQIGTYGVLALGLVTLLRIVAVAALLGASGWAVMLGAVASRAMMPLCMYALPHARSDGLSQSVGKPQFSRVILACGIAASAVWIGLGKEGVVAFVMALGVSLAMIRLAKHKIGGQTGDVLGATQQLAEAAFLLTLTALFA